MAEKKKEITATFDQDSKQYHRYVIDETQVFKSQKGNEIPGGVIVRISKGRAIICGAEPV